MTVSARSCPRTASQLLDEDFLDTRASILEIAAFLDRLDRATDGESIADARHDALRQALRTLAAGTFPRVDAILRGGGEATAAPRPGPRRPTGRAIPGPEGEEAL